MATFFSSFSTMSNILLLHSSPEKAAFQGILTLTVASSQIPRGNSCRTTAYAEQLSWEELSWEKKSHFRTAWLLFKGSWHGVTIFSLSAEGFFWYIILMCPWTQEFTSKCCLKSKHSNTQSKNRWKNQLVFQSVVITCRALKLNNINAKYTYHLKRK